MTSHEIGHLRLGATTMLTVDQIGGITQIRTRSADGGVESRLVLTEGEVRQLINLLCIAQERLAAPD